MNIYHNVFEEIFQKNLNRKLQPWEIVHSVSMTVGAGDICSDDEQ